MRKTSILFVCMIALVAFAAWAPNAGAFTQWSNPDDQGNCAACHGDFEANNYVSFNDGTPWGTSLHNGHRNTMLSGDCDTCHGQGPRFPVLLAVSVGGTNFPPISCVGCHGRDGDLNNGQIGAGLRQHHENANAASCGGCHSDNNPATFAAVGENDPPPYYFTPDAAHPFKPTDPCDANGSESVFGAIGTDNDGDLIYDGDDPDCGVACTDIDGDTFSPDGGDCGLVDCDDNNADVNPDATELCNGIDDNCSGTIDDGFPVGDACTAGVGVCQADGVLACTADGSDTECDATPGTPTETPEQTCDDNADNDCDGLTDCADSVDCGAAPNCVTCTDNDGDTYNVEGGDCGPVDCDDNNADVNPGATEICNGIDDNCSGTIDDGFPVGDACTAGVGVCQADGVLACTADGSDTECDATPGTPTETPEQTCDDNADNDCDGLTDCSDTDDCGAAPNCATCTDNDGDTYNVEGGDCGPVDCDDNNADVNPGATEICNGIDDNCSGTIDDSFPVGDACTAGVGVCQADGVLACTTDGSGTECDATPGTPTETPEQTCDDNADNDCDGLTDCTDTDDCGTAPNCEACTDNDGDTFSPDGGDCGLVDCDDNNADVNPGATEICNGIDDNCSGTIDDGFNVGDDCTVGTGVCENPGTVVCTPDGTGSICDAEPGTPTETPEMTCNDQLDNDCDAAVDCADSDCVDDPACVTVGPVEAEIEAPGSINGANRGRTSLEIEFELDGLEDGMPVEIAELVCGGDVSGEMVPYERINAEDDEENEFVALFRTLDLMLVCEDTKIVCTGTLADGTTFMGMDETRIIRDFERNRCPKIDDSDDDDDDDD